MRALLLTLSLVAACSGSDEPPSGEVDANQLTRISTPEEPEPDLEATVRLQPLGTETVIGSGLDPYCSFTRNGETLVRIEGGGAQARIDGQVRRLAAMGPVGPTGGFFENSELSLSIGRTRESEARAKEAGDAPARAATTNRITKVQSEVGGQWSCEE